MSGKKSVFTYRYEVILYLNDSNMQKDTSKSDCNGGSSHNCRTSKESHTHWEDSNCFPTCNDSRRQCHEQTCCSMMKISWKHYDFPISSKGISCEDYLIVISDIPRLNIAIPRPASERIDIDLAIIAGIWTFHLKDLALVTSLIVDHAYKLK